MAATRFVYIYTVILGSRSEIRNPGAAFALYDPLDSGLALRAPRNDGVLCRHMTDARTRAFYDAEAAAYAARSRVSPYLNDFIAELAPHAAVLDLGCGGGQDSAALRDAGFAVTSMDASPGLAAEAKHLYNIDVRVLDFGQLDDVAAFDGIWASASLHHAQTAALPSIFATLHRTLKPGGVLHASLKAGDTDRRDKLHRFFCAMDEEKLRELVAGWRDVRIEHGQGGGYDNEPTPWLRLRAHVPHLRDCSGETA